MLLTAYVLEYCRIPKPLTTSTAVTVRVGQPTASTHTSTLNATSTTIPQGTSSNTHHSASTTTLQPVLTNSERQSSAATLQGTSSTTHYPMSTTIHESTSTSTLMINTKQLVTIDRQVSFIWTSRGYSRSKQPELLLDDEDEDFNQSFTQDPTLSEPPDVVTVVSCVVSVVVVAAFLITLHFVLGRWDEVSPATSTEGSSVQGI